MFVDMASKVRLLLTGQRAWLSPTFPAAVTFMSFPYMHVLHRWELLVSHSAQ